MWPILHPHLTGRSLPYDIIYSLFEFAKISTLEDIAGGPRESWVIREVVISGYNNDRQIRIFPFDIAQQFETVGAFQIQIKQHQIKMFRSEVHHE
jgi:hypothetical protein